VTLGLLFAAVMLGLAAMPHCALMCSAPCAAVAAPTTPHTTPHTALFHVGRALGYSAAGALAASSVAALGGWVQAAPALRPVWVLVHLLLLLLLGLWWLVVGRQPAALLRRSPAAAGLPLQFHKQGQAHAPAWRSGAAGLAWVAWPCGALQAALLLAAMASHAAGGAAVMLAFAVASAPGLVLAPWALGRLQQWQQRQRWQRVKPGQAGHSPAPGQVATLGLRAAGLALVLASGWALSSGLWHRAAAWCGF
jgi:uncharacterized protein